eukprot:jgi/Tetstr1/426623/TSEL_016900.t1
MKSNQPLRQDRRSLLNYYRDDPFTKPVLPPLDDTGHGAARDEVHGSVDKHFISEDLGGSAAGTWANTVMDPDVWPVLAKKFIPMFEQACRRPDIRYQLWSRHHTGKPRGFWRVRVGNMLRTFGVPGDSVLNEWVPRGPLPYDSALSPPELCRRLTRRYMRYLERLQWTALAVAQNAGLTKPGATLDGLGPVSEQPVELADVSEEHALAQYRRDKFADLTVLSGLVLTTIAAQVLLPVLMLVSFTREIDSVNACPMNADWMNRVLFFFLFITVVVYSTFPEYAQNNFMTYDIFLHSYAVTSPVMLKLGRLVNDITLLLVIPSVTFYLFILSLSHHVKGKMLLEYLIKGSR